MTDPATPATQTPTTPAAPSAPASDPGASTPAAQATPSPTVDSGQMIPKYRFDEINQKRKDAEAALADVAASVIDSMVPENMRAIVPELPSAQKIKWVYEAAKSGIFNPIRVSGPDPKRPGEKPPVDFSGLNPQSIMSHGYKK